MELIFWAVIIAAAIGGRFAGSLLGRRLGARHAVAWLGGLTGFMLGAIGFATLWGGMTVRELRGGPLAGYFIIGCVLATVGEGLFTIVEVEVRIHRTGRLADPTAGISPGQFSLRGLMVLVAVICIVLSAYRMTVVPWRQASRSYRRVDAAVYSLAHHRPEGVTKNEWSFVIGWTHKRRRQLSLPCLRGRHGPVAQSGR